MNFGKTIIWAASIVLIILILTVGSCEVVRMDKKLAAVQSGADPIYVSRLFENSR